MIVLSLILFDVYDGGFIAYQQSLITRVVDLYISNKNRNDFMACAVRYT